MGAKIKIKISGGFKFECEGDDAVKLVDAGINALQQHKKTISY